MKNKDTKYSIDQSTLKRTMSSITIVVFGLLFFARFAEANSDYFLVKGATEAELGRARAVLEKAAYGPSQASTLKGEDSCEFYKPPQKLRLFKRMPTTDPCQGYSKGSAILANTKSNVLYLCNDGATVADYDFSMGREGNGKRVEGDRKTPLGTYPLAKPAASEKFSIFIPIGYPTVQQKQQGYSGSDVGIHGPSRAFRCMGFFNVIVNWTQGCLAVSSDIFVKEIARFVEANDTRTITIF